MSAQLLFINHFKVFVRCYVDDIFVNYEIVAQGYGFAYTVFPFSKSDQFEAAELAARSSNLGLWGGCELQETNGRFETNPT